MSIRHCLNATTRTNKRKVTTQMIEVSNNAGTVGVQVGENNPNMVDYDDGAATVWFYPGREHINISTSQGGTTAP